MQIIGHLKLSYLTYNHHAMRIAIVYNERPSNLDRHDPTLEKLIEGDEWKTTQAIGEAVHSLGHQCMYYKITDDIYERLKADKQHLDLVFNLSEGINDSKDREAHIPMLCEILKIPYTGPSPLSAALILNKSRAKEIWRANGLTTAASQLLHNTNDKLLNTLTFPLIVKPNGEGSGIGIKDTSVVNNKKEFTVAVHNIINHYHQPALVETYLSGREFTVAIVGNDLDLTVLPIIEINFAAFPLGSVPIDSYDAKFVYGATGMSDMHATEFCPAILNKRLEKKIVDLSKAAYLAIGCRDFGRLDIRLDAHDEPHVLEINHPPGLMSDPAESSFFTISARTYGWDFPTLINKILNSAILRLNLN